MADWDVLLAPWVQEPEPVPELRFTSWAEAGWLAWNEHAVEVQIAEFVAGLVEWLQPNVIIETGVGQGFINRRILLDVPYWGFESDHEWRQQLQTRYLVGIEPSVTFSAEQVQQADLTILDSNFPLRFAELFLWFDQAKPDGWLFVHDTGNGHPPGSAYGACAGIVRSFQLQGLWLGNPRGAWVGRRDGIVVEEVTDLWAKHKP